MKQQLTIEQFREYKIHKIFFEDETGYYVATLNDDKFSCKYYDSNAYKAIKKYKEKRHPFTKSIIAPDDFEKRGLINVMNEFYENLEKPKY